MVKFIFITLQNRTGTYMGPSGVTYSITKDVPFEVTNALDIEFFDKNHRFERAGLLKSTVPKAVNVLSEEESVKVLYEELVGIKGVSEDVAKLLSKVYLTREKIIECLEQRMKLDPGVDDEQHGLLREYFLSEGREKSPVIPKKKVKKKGRPKKK